MLQVLKTSPVECVSEVDKVLLLDVVDDVRVHV